MKTSLQIYIGPKSNVQLAFVSDESGKCSFISVFKLRIHGMFFNMWSIGNTAEAFSKKFFVVTVHLPMFVYGIGKLLSDLNSLEPLEWVTHMI